jgi:2-oxoglutarate/2-oxoacid ferredoxin oxidoreductase subunit alpha
MIRSFEWKIGGQQGEGIDSPGEILSKTLFRYGYYVKTYRQFMSRIKGGHTNFKVRAAQTPVHHAGDHVDVLLCLDNETLPVNEGELKETSVVIMEGEYAVTKSEKGYTIASFPLKKIASDLGNAKAKNMITLGMTGALISLPKEEFFGFIEEVFGKKGEVIVQSNKEAIEKGYALVEEHLSSYVQTLEPVAKTERLYISGNEATAFGAFMAGCRFLSAYPITPASEIMEWLATQLPKVGGTVMQVEDEIAGIMFAIGASFAGARAMTSTSGPGISLKTEALGVAGMSETPIVIVNSQRSGPSTGLPTKHEQSDLQHMLYATHGEIPRIVLYPSTVEDAFYIAAEAFNLADLYQCPVIVALDLGLSMNKNTISPIDASRVSIHRGKVLSQEEVEALNEHIFKRYRFTEDGISPRVFPGTKGGVHTTSSNEHGEDGYVTEDPVIRTEIMKKRMKKIKHASIQTPFHARDAQSSTVLVAMGSTCGVVEEAQERLAKEGLPCNTLFIQQLHPLPVEKLRPHLLGKKVIVIENNYEGQLANWLKQHLPIHENVYSITQFDGNPFSVQDVVNQVEELL